MSTASRLSGPACAILLVSVGSMRAQSTSRPSTQPATRPAVEQPEEFLKLAARAKRQSLHVRCMAVGEMSGAASTQPATTRPVTTEVAIEFWATRLGWRGRTEAEGEHASDAMVRDGRSYWVQRLPSPYETVAQWGDAPPIESQLAALGVAGVFLDAVNGYAHAAAGARFVPIDTPKGELGEAAPRAVWFELVRSGGREPYLLAQGTRSAKMAIGEDGLPRALILEAGRSDGGFSTQRLTIVFHDLHVGQAKDVDLRFPADAVKLEWKEAETGQVVRPPASLFAERKEPEAEGRARE
jgi:hypothetical protein